MSEMLTVNDVAERMNISKITVYRMLENKEIPAAKIRGVWRVDRDDLEEYIERQRVS